MFASILGDSHHSSGHSSARSSRSNSQSSGSHAHASSLNPKVQARMAILRKQAEFLGHTESRSRENSLHPLEEGEDERSTGRIKSIELQRAKVRINNPSPRASELDMWPPGSPSLSSDLRWPPSTEADAAAGVGGDPESTHPEAHALGSTYDSPYAPHAASRHEQPSATPSRPRPLRVDPAIEALRKHAEEVASKNSLKLPLFPTSNPHVAHVLATHYPDSSPFVVNPSKKPSAVKLSNALEANVYYPEGTVARVKRFRPRAGDVIVCGVPRCGQTPVLRALDALRKGVAPSPFFNNEEKQALVRDVVWLEHDTSSEVEHLPAASPIGSSSTAGQFFAADSHSHRRTSPSGRLLKTHMTLAQALGGDPCPRGHLPVYKAIVVLRNPADTRVSWFRHLRQLYRHFHPDVEGQRRFDDAVKLDDLAQYPAPRTSVVKEEQCAENLIAETLRALSSPQVCVVFYEELLIDARVVVERLARFTGWGIHNEQLIHRIAYALEDDSASHPKWGLRRGSSACGIKYFSPSSLRFIDDRWNFIVRLHSKGEANSYDQVYSALTKQPYPLPYKVKSKHASSAAHISGSFSSQSSSGVSSDNSGSAPRTSSRRRLSLNGSSVSSSASSLFGFLARRSSARSVFESTGDHGVPVDPDDDDSTNGRVQWGRYRVRRPSILGGGKVPHLLPPTTLST